MKLKVEDLDWSISCSEAMALFGRPIDKSDEISLAKSGLRDAQTRAAGCLGWIWRKWLAAAPPEEITARVEAFINRSLDLRERCKCYDAVPRHDLLLVSCAVFASTASQLQRVAETIADTSGDKGQRTMDNGELFVASWAGILKHRILGNQEKASEQASQIWGAYRDPTLHAAPKPLVTPWLRRDWRTFMKAQQSDFGKWWQRARKWGGVISESEEETVVTTRDFLIEGGWCWAHCALALLAYRGGADVATDPLWLPPHALKCVRFCKAP